MEINDAMGNLIGLGGLIVAFVSVLLSYLSNRANVRARRVEIVTEKSIEAFREMLEKLHLLLTDYDPSTLSEDVDEFTLNYIFKYRLYIPTTIAQDFVKITQEINDLSDVEFLVDKEQKEKKIDYIMERIRELILRMQKYIGLETKEPPRRRITTK